jgi:hypothetical protein
MANKVQIANKALSLIGMKRITSLDDDSPQALAVNATWDITLESVLSAGVFTFSLRRVALAELSTTLAFTEENKSVVYQRPTGALRIAGFYPKTALCSVEDDKIISDTASLCAWVVVSDTDTTKFFPAFTEALAIKLAADISFALTNGTTKGGELLQVYESVYLPRAKSADSTQGDAPLQEEAEILLAKYVAV